MVNSGHFCSPGPNNFTLGHLIKIERLLVANVTHVGSPDRAEHDILGWFWMFFGQFGPFFETSDPGVRIKLLACLQRRIIIHHNKVTSLIIVLKKFV